MGAKMVVVILTYLQNQSRHKNCHLWPSIIFENISVYVCVFGTGRETIKKSLVKEDQ